MPTVSILIPCYNAEAYVGDAIASVLAQTWDDCEIIVVDDGSTDDSLDVVRQFDEECIQVIPQSNQGAQVARIRAFEASTGDLIQYLDADDLLSPQKIEAQVEALRDEPGGTLAVASTVHFDHGTNPKKGFRSESVDEVPWLTSDDPVYWLAHLWSPSDGWGMVSNSAWLTPRSVINRAGPWDSSVDVDDDGEFFTRVVLASTGIRYVRDVSTYYRRIPNTITVSSNRSRKALIGWMNAIDSKRFHAFDAAHRYQAPSEIFDMLRLGIARQYVVLATEAHPTHGDLVSSAEERAQDLGLSTPPPMWGTWKGELIQKALGWKAASWIDHYTRPWR